MGLCIIIQYIHVNPLHTFLYPEPLNSKNIHLLISIGLQLFPESLLTPSLLRLLRLLRLPRRPSARQLVLHKHPRALPRFPTALLLGSPPPSLSPGVNRSLFLGYGIQGDVGLPGDPGQPMINGVVEFVGSPKGDKGTQVCWKQHLTASVCEARRVHQGSSS